MNGKLYRCPFSANATNLKSIPIDESDYVDLSDDNKNLETIKNEIRNLYKNKKYLTACSYCNGRDYSSTIIPSALQAKKPMEYEIIEE